MARFYEKLTKPTALADGDIFVISVGSGTSWIDYKITYSQLKDVIKTISDMQNYYTKSQTYTQAEVNAAISSAIGAVYKPSGSKTCAELVSSLLIAANKGNVYNITDSGVTTEDFVDGAGKTINAGDNVSIVEVSTDVFKFDLLSGFIDLTGYQTKNLASAIEGQTTVEGALAALSANKANLSEVYTKTQINDDFVKKSATAGLLKNDGSVDTNTYVPAVTGKGLSTEDYTSPEKAKLAGISDGATKTESSLTNGHIEIDDVDVTVYDDTTLDSRVDVVEQDLSTDTATVEGNPLNFTTLTAQKANETVISLEPIQDLHGYDHPWPAGGGKNKLPMTVDGIKAANTSGTWSGNTYTHNGISVTIQTDDGNNVTGILVNGTATATITFSLKIQLGLISGETYTFSGCPSGGGAGKYYCTTGTSADGIIDSGNGITKTWSSSYRDEWFIIVANGYTASNLLFYPMIRLATETDATFAPYSNYCPIDGRTETSLVGCGANIWDEEWEEGNINTNTGQDEVSNLVIRSKGYISCFPDTEYYFLNVAEQEHFVFFYRDDKTYISRTNNVGNGIFETPEDCYFIRFRMTTPYGNIYNGDISINYPSTDHVYHPFVQSNNITIQFGEKVYGAKVELEKGTVTVDTGIVDLGDLEWTLAGSAQIRHSTPIANITPAPKIVPNSVKMNGVCSDYQIVKGELIPETDPSIGMLNQTGIWVNDSRYDGEPGADFKAHMSGVKLCYKLATPRTITLTPNEISLLSGVNNISTDCDSISLTYRDGKVATLGDLDGLVKKIADCEDVEITDLQAGDSLVWDATAGKWKNQQSTSMVVYDGTERVIGTWFGETLYEKSFEFTNIAQGDNSFTHNISNLKEIINVHGTVTRVNSNLNYNLYHNPDVNTSDKISIDYISDSIIRVRIGSSYTTLIGEMKIHITIQYTKNNS